MNLHTPLRRGRFAVPLALIILAASLLAPGSGTDAVAVRDGRTTRLGCAVGAAIGVDRVHVLQLPGDLPLHLQLRLRGCSQQS